MSIATQLLSGSSDIQRLACLTSEPRKQETYKDDCRWVHARPSMLLSAVVYIQQDLETRVPEQ